MTQVQTKDETFSFFLDGKNRILFMTADTMVYNLFSNYLPDMVVPGRLIVLQGTPINPLTIFTRREFDEFNQRMRRLGVRLNRYKIARILNYGLEEAGTLPPVSDQKQDPHINWGDGNQ
ncbi:MAG TPA: hypothetical protein VG621_00580 [Candidatus Paceibacterota bacterium]|nr:hypothetical protein [Candidatus Paceibacterota bacterium]